MTIHRSAFEERYFMDCPFEFNPDGGTELRNEGHEHPRRFLHDHYQCEGVVDIEELLIWMAQRVAQAYMNPAKEV